MKYFAFLFVCLAGSLLQTEVLALHCYQCTYTETEGTGFGPASCANGKTPDKSLLVDCEDFVGPRAICHKVFAIETSPTATARLTTRQCIADLQQPLTCTKYVDPPQAITTDCYCNTDGCDPKISEDDGGSGSGSGNGSNASAMFMVSVPVTVFGLLPLFYAQKLWM